MIAKFLQISVLYDNYKTFFCAQTLHSKLLEQKA